MKIVIDISEEDYNRIKDIPNVFESLVSRMYKAIQDGTPLPKGHGRLIDAKEVYRKFYSRCLAKVAKEILSETDTIIEADMREVQSGSCE